MSARHRRVVRRVAGIRFPSHPSPFAVVRMHIARARLALLRADMTRASGTKGIPVTTNIDKKMRRKRVIQLLAGIRKKYSSRSIRDISRDRKTHRLVEQAMRQSRVRSNPDEYEKHYRNAHAYALKHQEKIKGDPEMETQMKSAQRSRHVRWWEKLKNDPARLAEYYRKQRAKRKKPTS